MGEIHRFTPIFSVTFTQASYLIMKNNHTKQCTLLPQLFNILSVLLRAVRQEQEIENNPNLKERKNISSQIT